MTTPVRKQRELSHDVPSLFIFDPCDCCSGLGHEVFDCAVICRDALELDGPLPAGSVVSVRAFVWNDRGERMQVFESRQKPVYDRHDGRIFIQLVPNALNCLRVERGDSREAKAPVSPICIYSQATVSMVPPAFVPGMLADITEQQINDELQRMIEEAKKVSKDLADFLNDHVSLSDDPESNTGKIDQGGGNTKANTRIHISRQQLKDALAAIAAETDSAAKAQMVEDLFRQLVAQLLHEATHRKGFVDGQVVGSVPGEEDRTTQALIARLIELMKKLKTHLPGQPAGATAQPLGDGEGLGAENASTWMTRLRTIIDIQKIYRFQRVAKNKEPWKTKGRNIQHKFDEFRRKLNEIKNDSSKNADQKKDAARQAYQEFKDGTATDKAALEREFDVEWKLDWNPDTLGPVNELNSTDKYKGEEIPH